MYDIFSKTKHEILILGKKKKSILSFFYNMGCIINWDEIKGHLYSFRYLL